MKKKIKHAQFLRSIESDGVTTAEVEFAWEDDFGGDVQQGSKYIAVLKKQGEGDYDVEKIVKNDAEFALDWYENADHQAFEDVTSDMPVRSGFVKEVLGFKDVQEDMECRTGCIRS